jgi:hypothetical protein
MLIVNRGDWWGLSERAFAVAVDNSKPSSSQPVMLPINSVNLRQYHAMQEHLNDVRG